MSLRLEIKGSSHSLAQSLHNAFLLLQMLLASKDKLFPLIIKVLNLSKTQLEVLVLGHERQVSNIKSMGASLLQGRREGKDQQKEKL